MENENNIIAKPMYKCAICEKIYDNIKDRNSCETNCIAKAEKAAKQEKLNKLLKEKEIRTKEIDEALNHVEVLLKEYIKDYKIYRGMYPNDIFNGWIPTHSELIKLFFG